jgi:hypothetical protein
MGTFGVIERKKVYGRERERFKDRYTQSGLKRV